MWLTGAIRSEFPEREIGLPVSTEIELQRPIIYFISRFYLDENREILYYLPTKNLYH
jgi:hypothetical protein